MAIGDHKSYLSMGKKTGGGMGRAVKKAVSSGAPVKKTKTPTLVQKVSNAIVKGQMKMYPRAKINEATMERINSAETDRRAKEMEKTATPAQLRKKYGDDYGA